MSEAVPWAAGELEGLAFAASALAPFFLEDPATGRAVPSFAAMATLSVDEAADQWPFAAPDEARPALALMQEGLAAGIGDEALVREYRRLFVGPQALPAPPWGSVYTDRDSIMFGESTLALRAWMRAHGVARTSDARTPEDHIGLMLALAAYVAEVRPELIDELLRDHVLTWAPHYLALLEEAAVHPFYQGLARLTGATLQGVQASRGLEVVRPRYYR